MTLSDEIDDNIESHTKERRCHCNKIINPKCDCNIIQQQQQQHQKVKDEKLEDYKGNYIISVRYDTRRMMTE